jgi:hypothetical protein
MVLSQQSEADCWLCVAQALSRARVVTMAETALQRVDAKWIVYDNGGEAMSVSDGRNAFVWDLSQWKWTEELHGTVLGQVLCALSPLQSLPPFSLSFSLSLSLSLSFSFALSLSLCLCVSVSLSPSRSHSLSASPSPSLSLSLSLSASLFLSLPLSLLRLVALADAASRSRLRRRLWTRCGTIRRW